MPMKSFLLISESTRAMGLVLKVFLEFIIQALLQKIILMAYYLLKLSVEKLHLKT